MKICVVGSGYVGLVTGACLADFGMEVTGVDNDAAKVEVLRAGEIPIYEPGLKTLVRQNMDAGRLRFTTELGPAVKEAQAVFKRNVADGLFEDTKVGREKYAELYINA